MAPIQLPASRSEIFEVIKRRPILTAAISFVTSTFLPGYRTLRERLAPVLSQWIQEKIDPQPESHDIESQVQQEDQVTNLQACIILYTYSRGNAVQTGHGSQTTAETLKFFTIKASCESYARQTGLHKVGHQLGIILRSGRSLQRTDTAVRKYICWLSLYCKSHQ